MNKRKTSQEVFNELLEHTKMSANKLATEIGLPTNVFLYRIKNGKNNISTKLAQQISNRFKEVNYAYLVSGQGTLTNDHKEQIPDNVFINTNGNVFTEKKDGSFSMRVRYLTFNTYQSYLKSLHDSSFEYQWDEATFCVDQFGKGFYQGFKTNNNSMNGEKLYDTPNNASLLGRELGKHHWQDGFRPTDSGWIILTQNNIYHKDIINYDNKNKTITCSSRNHSPEFANFKLKIDDINQIFKVIKRTF